MKNSISSLLLCLCLISSCSKKSNPAAGTSSQTPTQQEKKILLSGYLPDYGMGRIDLMNLEYIDRVNYFSIEPDQNGQFQISDADSANLELLKTKLNSQQQLFLVVGGWVKSQNIPAMASDANKRSAYIQALAGFCKRRKISGVNLDWEDYPGPVSQASFVTLVKEMSQALHAQSILFTVALGVNKGEWGYKIKEEVDQINIMSYGTLDASGNQSTTLQMKNALNGYVDLGVPKAKLLAGVPFFGKRTAAPNSMEYFTIVAQSQPAAASNKFGDYSFNGKTLLQDKTAFLRQSGYGGIMIWELSQDVSVTSEFSLLKSIYDRNR